ncbi:MAG: Fis family transcriptional regulator [Thermoplasmata archaeon HGW-Thermoplasmata-1]|nr:MAG: Fis family transcriptional regulator [Thermoplasmata archaeon HGW-Thermoplasmata-1]
MGLAFFGRGVTKIPALIIILMLGVTAFFGVYAVRLSISSDLETFLPQDDPSVTARSDISRIFGKSEMMQLVFVSDDVVDPEALNEMLDAQEAIIADDARGTLLTPNNPASSIISLADLIVMGSITMDYEDELISTFGELTDTLEGVSLVGYSVPMQNINRIVSQYREIYDKCPALRSEALAVVMPVYQIDPSSASSGGMADIIPLTDNVMYILLQSKDFSMKSKALTLLAAPTGGASEGSSDALDTPLVNYFLEDMASQRSVAEKGASTLHFVTANNQTLLTLSYVNVSLKDGIDANKLLIVALSTLEKYPIKSGLDLLINQVSKRVTEAEPKLPSYRACADSVTALRQYTGTGAAAPVSCVSDAIQKTADLMNVASEDEKELLGLFDSTLRGFAASPQIFYSVDHQANLTWTVADGFNSSYTAMVGLKGELPRIRTMMDGNFTKAQIVENLTALRVDLTRSNENLSIQKSGVEEMIATLNSPFGNWFMRAMRDMGHVIRNAPYDVARKEIEIFNFVASMMMDGSGGAASAPFDFSAPVNGLKTGFDSGEEAAIKEMLQDMFLRELAMLRIGIPSADLEIDMDVEIPAINLNPSIADKRAILSALGNDGIAEMVDAVKSYDSSDLVSVAGRLSVIAGLKSKEINNLDSQVKNIISVSEFIYAKTFSSSVENSLVFYRDAGDKIGEAADGINFLQDNIGGVTGFARAMNTLDSGVSSIISNDFDGTSAASCMMILTLNSSYLPDEGKAEHANRLETVQKRIALIAADHTSAEVKLLSDTMISKATEETLSETITLLIPIAIALVVFMLLLTFRSVVDTLLGVLGLGMAMAWAYGFGVLMNFSFNQISATVAILLIGLGIDYSIHTTMRYREELRKKWDVKRSTGTMISHLGVGLALTTVTTVVAFLSNLSSPIPPIVSFGIMNAVGIFGAFVIFLTVIPAIRMLIDLRREKTGQLMIRELKKRRNRSSGVTFLDRALYRGAEWSTRHRYIVICVVGLLGAASLVGATQIETDFDSRDFLPEGIELTDTIRYLTDNFAAANINDAYILINGNVSSAAAVNAINATMSNIRNDPFVDFYQSTSITALIKTYSEMDSSFSTLVKSSDIDGDGLPDANIVSIYDWLYENTGEASSVVEKNNGSYGSALIKIRSYAGTTNENGRLYKELLKDIKPLEDAGLSAHPTGMSIITYKISDSLQGSQWTSMLITLGIAFVILAFVFAYKIRSISSLGLGMITMIPVAISLIWILGTMYLLGISFNVVTVTVTSLTIGLGIDYAIHVTHRFIEELEKGETIDESLKRTVMTTGTAVFGAVSTTVAGFGTLILSSMTPLREMGIITLISIVYSFLLAIFVLPPLLKMWAHRAIKMDSIRHRKKQERLENKLRHEVGDTR